MGQIFRILIILFAVWVAFRLLKRWLGAKDRPRATTAQPGRAAPMQRCTHCGIFLPRAEGVESNGEFYCCEEHRRLGPPRT